MITKIGLRNFKCFRDLEISPKLVTVLIGPNGTGKSGVLQALLLLKQSRDPNQVLELQGSSVRSASEDFMLHGVDRASDRVGFSLWGTWPVRSMDNTIPVKFDVHLDYSRDTIHRGEKRGSTQFEYSDILFDIPAGMNQTVKNSIGIEMGVLALNGLNIASMRVLDFQPPDESRDWPIRPFEDFLNEASVAPARVMENMKMVPAIRGLVRLDYSLREGPAEVISSASGLDTQEDQIVSTLVYSSSTQAHVSEWMEKITGVGFKTDLAPGRNIRPLSTTTTGDINITMEGSGTNSLIHLLFELARAETGATILIEEPELHLHPKAQGDLTQVLVEEAKANDKQVIMTTHGEHILGRLLVLVAEGVISKEEVAIYAFDKDGQGICSATEIEVTDRGQTMGGLPGFYDANLDEMDRLVEALRKNS